MIDYESRLCNHCGYEVTFMVIDADYEIVCQFVVIGLVGLDAHHAVVTDYCPQCENELTLDSTSKKNKSEKS